MNLKPICTGTARPTVAGFLALLAVVALVALAKGKGVLEATLARRAIGLLVGVMMIIIGNLVPKLRPLNSPLSDPADAGTAERSAGWTLVLAGIAYIALFAFAPLDQAAALSSFIGIGAIMVIAVHWTWLAQGTLFGNAPSPEARMELSEHGIENRKVIVSLLFGLLYVLAGTWIVFLVKDNSRVREFATWMILALGMLYAVLYAVLESRRSTK